MNFRLLLRRWMGSIVRRGEGLLRCWVAVWLAGGAAMASAHDFWVQPSSFSPAPGGEVGLALMAGHGKDKRQSPIPARRITRFVSVAPDGRAAPLEGRTLRTDCAGVYTVLVLTDDAAQSHLPAARFNAYLHEEGLHAVLAHRERHRLQGEPGAERYSRVAKALLVAGSPSGPDGADWGGMSEVRAFELPLELVLERGAIAGAPGTDASLGARAAAAVGRELAVRVLYKGRPLPGSLVKLTDLAHDETPVGTATADARGRVQFTLPYCGNWRLNVVWSEPVQRGDGIDYETIFSSLAFAGCPGGMWDNSARNEEQSPHRSLP